MWEKARGDKRWRFGTGKRCIFILTQKAGKGGAIDHYEQSDNRIDMLQSVAWSVQCGCASRHFNSFFLDFVFSTFSLIPLIHIHTKRNTYTSGAIT